MHHPVLTDCTWVVDQALDVKINPNKLIDFSQALHQSNHFVSDWSSGYSLNLPYEQSLQANLVVHCLNFCFWPSTPDLYWSVSFNHKNQGGSLGIILAIQRDLQTTHRLLEAKFLSQITLSEFSQIFRGSGVLPLIEHRVKHLREAGKVLLTKFGGQFSNVLYQSDQNAVKLLNQVITHFPSFQDTATYRGKKIHFYKRAQVLVWDTSIQIKKHHQLPQLKNTHQLSALADYRLPQLLRHQQILQYSHNLRQKIDNRVMLKPGSSEEIEIRASTIVAIEQIKNHLNSLGISLNTIELNNYLWLYAKSHRSRKPHHLVKSIYY